MKKIVGNVVYEGTPSEIAEYERTQNKKIEKPKVEKPKTEIKTKVNRKTNKIIYKRKIKEVKRLIKENNSKFIDEFKTVFGRSPGGSDYAYMKKNKNIIKKRWTDEEILYVIHKAKVKTEAEIAKHLNRSKASVISLIWKLKNNYHNEYTKYKKYAKEFL